MVKWIASWTAAADCDTAMVAQGFTVAAATQAYHGGRIGKMDCRA
jgi:hypothetical protein